MDNIQVNYDGTVFHAKIEFPETEFHMQTDNINDFKKEFLSEMSKTFDDTVHVHESEPSRYSIHTNLENGNKKTYEIGSIKHKYYDLETVTVNENLKYISYNKNNMERTRYKKYHHVELVNGIGTGQIHFITDNGSYLMLPWCYIISMVPCEE